jgi:hypothetical protein
MLRLGSQECEEIYSHIRLNNQSVLHLIYDPRTAMIVYSRLSNWLSATAAVLLLSLGLPFSAHAQISADRPGFGTGSATVGAGTFQAELGYQFRSTWMPMVGQGFTTGANTHELGQGLFRYGITDALELRAGLNSYVLISGSNSGYTDYYSGASLGAKVRLFQTQTMRLGGLATLDLPTELPSGPDDRARQELRLAFDTDLGDRFQLAINGGTSFYYSAGIQNDRAVEWLFIPTLSADLTLSLDAYVGYAGFYGTFGGNSYSRDWLESGVTYRLTPDTQLDLNLGTRIGMDDVSDLSIGVGVSKRF